MLINPTLQTIEGLLDVLISLHQPHHQLLHLSAQLQCFLMTKDHHSLLLPTLPQKRSARVTSRVIVTDLML